jgi:hypothetical protein
VSRQIYDRNDPHAFRAAAKELHELSLVRVVNGKALRPRAIVSTPDDLP